MEHSRHFFNPARKNAFLAAKRDGKRSMSSKEKFFSKSKTKQKSVVVPTGKEEIASEHVEKKKFNYPASLGRSIPGEYSLFINRENVVTLKVTTSKKILVLTATGCFKYLLEDGVNNIWYIPCTAVEKEFFTAPEWMEEDQKKWTICAVKDICRLLDIFKARIRRKKEFQDKIIK